LLSAAHVKLANIRATVLSARRRFGIAERMFIEKPHYCVPNLSTGFFIVFSL
jgi:hypothetical protein